jgi:hypothetical protein
VSSSSIGALLDCLEERSVECHSIMVVRHGHVVAEGWWAPYSADRPHLLYSLTKSFTSTAVGLAVADGLLSLDDRIVNVLPDHVPADVSEVRPTFRPCRWLRCSHLGVQPRLYRRAQERDGPHVRGMEPQTHQLRRLGERRRCPRCRTAPCCSCRVRDGALTCRGPHPARPALPGDPRLGPLRSRHVLRAGSQA